MRHVRKLETIFASIIKNELDQVIILLVHPVLVLVKDELLFGFIPEIGLRLERNIGRLRPSSLATVLSEVTSALALPTPFPLFSRFVSSEAGGNPLQPAGRSAALPHRFVPAVAAIARARLSRLGILRRLGAAAQVQHSKPQAHFVDRGPPCECRQAADRQGLPGNDLQWDLRCALPAPTSAQLVQRIAPAGCCWQPSATIRPA